jgi:ribosomal protein S18 acetylase RimI-like enzyme
MSDFPISFAPQTVALDKTLFSESDQKLIDHLAELGYEIHSGLTTSYADDISKMCLQPSIKEYCPNDSGRRFTDQEATENWLSKGRAAFLLLKKEANHELSLSGYGWAGLEKSTHVMSGETTFALRVGEADQGKGLATPYCRLILAGAAAIYEAKNMWLETWSSDSAAVHIYHKLGFVDEDQVDDMRPTSSGQTVPDTRLYMYLANDKL